MPPPLNVVLLALTGFGNPVLEALLGDRRVRLSAVFTHRYDGPFPYYTELPLPDLCVARGVPCHHDIRVGSEAGLAVLRALAPDVIVVSTFKDILRAPVLAIPALGAVNLHPSLLPRHRGPCPTQAALLADDRISGVSAHVVTPGLDEGDILLQRAVSIEDVPDDGALRQRLASLAGTMVPELIGLWEGGARLSGRPQDPRLATAAPRPAAEDGFLERLPTADAVRRAVRALNPVPGTSIAVDGQRVAVDRCVLIGRPGPARPRVTEGLVEVGIGSVTVRLLRTARTSPGPGLQAAGSLTPARVP